MAPRSSRTQAGGREPKSAAVKARASNRAGITKRKGRVDGDGDMSMDGATRRVKTNTASNETSSSGRPATRAAASQRARGASKAAQTVLKHLTNGKAGDLASRVSNVATSKSKGGALTYLRVHGLKQSKAASNPDGGLKDLLGFLERKATSLIEGRRTRQVIIRKVCTTIDKIPGRRNDTRQTYYRNTIPYFSERKTPQKLHGKGSISLQPFLFSHTPIQSWRPKICSFGLTIY